MRKLNIENLDLVIYEEVLENGLKVYLCNIPRHNIHARITSLFGGSILEFKLKGQKEFKKVPAGVAHFLEHKLFDKKDYDPLKTFENNGASGNAFTNEFITSYHFTGARNFDENLNELLRFVSDPYFTDENVLKEKGIISQEKKEDLDNNYSIVYDRSLINTIHNLDYKNTVLGSLDDIESVTKEDLYACYDTFYHPSNMILTVCGDIDIQKTMKTISDFYNNKVFDKCDGIIIKDKVEPESVVKKFDTIYKDCNSSRVLVTYKIKKPRKIKDKYLNRLYMGFLADMKFSGLSDIADIVSNDSNYLSSITPRLSLVGDYYLMCFSVTLKDYTDEAVKLIDDTIKSSIFDKESFDLIKKSIINSMILSSESPYDICSFIVNHIRLYSEIITDSLIKAKNLDFNIFKDFVKGIDFSNRSVVVLKLLEKMD